MSRDPVALLRRHLGYPGFRPGQEELVRSVLDGRDALGILPTGGGKSVCYQIPALALDGLTLVVTPLVSLMEDQVARAREAGLRADCLTAGQGASARRRIGAAAAAGERDILFVSPERLETRGFAELVRRLDVRLLAVDEAHCISEWGHDFRPAYRRIGAVRTQVRCPLMALTATATPRVRSDVADNLRLRDPTVVVRSFDRPNLSWSVRTVRRGADRIGLLWGLLRRHRGTAIVYAPTRRSVDSVRDALATRGVVAEAYHAGLPPAERSRVQRRFLSGGCRLVVATNAFGMGIDKADVRLVAHAQLPSTLEAYYQEAGRAGRDGDPAWCVALHGRGDGALGRRFLDRSHPPARVLARLHRTLRGRADHQRVVRIALPELAAAVGRGTAPGAALDALRALVRSGAVHPFEALPEKGTEDPAGGSQPMRLGIRSRAGLSASRRLRRGARAKLGAVRRYATTRGCRRRALLRYFGEVAPERCGSCDRCGAP
jgi:ATP-dependent DNA helicase RecQ